MGRVRRGRKVNGVLVLNKPPGMTSNDAVQQVKRIFAAQKVGHTGSLDPLATGVLPLCFGEATKFSQFLLDSDKKYRAKIRLGITTATGDADGEIVEEKDASGVSAGDVEKALGAFRGAIKQLPPMYSALKHNGQPLYKLARQGIEVERKVREVTVFHNEMTDFCDNELVLELHCTKGTYVRSIAEDLGKALGCGAHVAGLHRRAAGPYSETDMLDLDALRQIEEQQALDALLQPMASAVAQWPEVKMVESTAFFVRQGQPVQVAHAPVKGWVQLMETTEGADDRFLGVGEILADGRVAPRRLVVHD
jgi:tRNA pseudouridine55 synthase